MRLRVYRFDARATLGQNKPAEVRANITIHVEQNHPALAREMRRHPPAST